MTEYHVDTGFDALGYAYANDNTPAIDKETRGCIELWCAVIEEGFRLEAAKLRGWVKSFDFRFICELAGVKPDVLREAAGKLERNEISLRSKIGRPKGKKKR